MNQLSKFSAKSLLVLRVALGWLMLYAGMVKVINPKWSAVGYLAHAQTFSGFYLWLSQASSIGLINFVNEWGLTLLGVSLILGAGVRLSSVLGTVLMLLYYFPANQFPWVANGFIVDDHIVYALILVFFAALNAGRFYGLDRYILKLSIFTKYPWLKKIWG